MSLDETSTPQYIITTPSEVDSEEQRDEDLNESVSSMSTIQRSHSSSTSTSTRCISHSTRSQSLQSSSIVEEQIAGAQSTSSSFISSTSLSQQVKAKSSATLVQKSSTSSTQNKSKFQSFLHQPDQGTQFLTAHQKHLRQFVRSTSTHTEGSSAKQEKYIRSASTQNEENEEGASYNLLAASSGTKLHQSTSILLSKSAETIESKVQSQSMRTQLTLSGGFLCPPNRKLTILSPIHAPPGLHEALKKGRSPLSPRISFPSTDESEMFG